MDIIKHHPILIVSATEAECMPTLQKMAASRAVSSRLFAGTLQECPIEVLIGGIGVVAIAFHLTQALMQRSYSRVISIGIAGSYTDDIPVGEIVQIVEDCFADLGIDDNGKFLNLYDAGLTNVNDNFSGGFITNPSPTLSSHPLARAITVQTASGNQQRIDELANRYHPQVETMENAAFFYVCRMMNVPFASFRSISNKVEPRNRKSWQVTEAIERVNTAINALL